MVPRSTSSTVTGSLNAARWYGYGTLLPNGQVLATSGADRDEVRTTGGKKPSDEVAELFESGDADLVAGRHPAPGAHLPQQRRR